MFGLFRKRQQPVPSGIDDLVGATGALDRALIELLQACDCERSEIDPFEVSAFSMTFISGVYLMNAEGNVRSKAEFLDRYVRSMPSRLLKVYGTPASGRDYDEPGFLQLYQQRYAVYSRLIPNALFADSENGGVHLLMTIFELAVSRSPPMLKIGLHQTVMLENLIEAMQLVKSRI